MASLHDIAPRLAKARDQRVAELRRERMTANLRRFRENVELAAASGVRATEAMRRMAAAFERSRDGT